MLRDKMFETFYLLMGIALVNGLFCHTVGGNLELNTRETWLTIAAYSYLSFIVLGIVRLLLGIWWRKKS